MSKKTILLISLASAAILSLALVLVASAVGGAAFTTYNPAVDGENKDVCKNSIINCNIYGAKEYVWLNGGPDANHLKPDGYYFFTVLVPGGQPNPNDADTGGDPPDSPAYTNSPKNLSDDYDTFRNRVFRTEGGEVVEYNGTHDLDSGAPVNGNGNKTRDPDGEPPFIRLFPYSDTTNPGGVYIMSICYLGETPDYPLYPVEPRDCKYDAFKVREGKMDYSFYLSGMKFSDLDAGGDKDADEPGLEGWTITIDGTGPDGLPIDEEVVTDENGFWEWQSPIYTFNGKDQPQDVTLTVCEVLQSGWTQSFPSGDGCYHITFTPTGFDEFMFLDFGNFKEELDVSKTAVTYYERQHHWDIAKSVDTENGYMHEEYPKIWLYTDGSGDETATWTVDVTYEGFTDYGYNVSGVITIENTGTVTAVITAVDDVLGGTAILVNCGVAFPYDLAAGDTLECTYDEDVLSKITGSNVATVTTERDTYSGSVDIIWGDPDKEFDKTVTIKDISDLFGEVELGTVTAPNDAQFTYTKAFSWDVYGADDCGDYVYDNTASIVETGQSASARLKVNVQCYIYESAWAEGSGAGVTATPFCDTFSNWGWTNQIGPGTYTGWTLWAGAGQCDPSKGLNVGTVDVEYDGEGFVVVTYNVGFPYLIKETHVYVDVNPFPFNASGPTTAPGQYYNASPFGGEDVYVIAHAVVGIPDPTFGP